MWDMEKMRDELEEELNEGGWQEESGDRDFKRSLVNFTGFSAAVCISTLMLQRRRAQMASDLCYDDPDPTPPVASLRPFPVSFDMADDSDVESVRRAPLSHFIPCSKESNSCAASVAESIQTPTHAIPMRPQMIHASVQVDRPLMVDRGSSPLPPECFDSEVDSEERFGLACGLWHFKPTALPEMDPEEDMEEVAHLNQKKWLQQFQQENEQDYENEKEEKQQTVEELMQELEELKCSKAKEKPKLDKAVTIGTTTFKDIIQYLLETPSSNSKQSNSFKSQNKVDDLFASDC